MDDWFDLIIFAIVIIANIIGGIVKIKQKKKAVKKLDLPPAEPVEYSEELTEEEFFEQLETEFAEENIPQTNYKTPQNVQNIPFPATTAANAPCTDCPPGKNDNFCPVQEMQVEDLDAEENDSFDYGEFMRTHGREAFILAEIILPANSRQSQC